MGSQYTTGFSREFHSRFRLEGLLGTGAGGRVFRGHQLSLGRPVAIKFLATAAGADQALRRFELEARSLVELNHPRIMKIYDFGVEGGTPFLVLELATGGTLRELMFREATVPPGDAVDFIIEILEILDHIHARGMIHRDLKPENIFVCEDEVLKLGDFGLVLRDTGPTMHTTLGVTVGTPMYMAPELLAGGPYSPATDLYAALVILYEMVTGTFPFSGSCQDILNQKAQSSPVRTRFQNPRVPPALADIIDDGIAMISDRRFHTARDLRRALKGVRRLFPGSMGVFKSRVLEARPPLGVGTERMSLAAPEGRRTRKAPARIAAMGLAGLFVGLLLGFADRGPDRPVGSRASRPGMLPVSSQSPAPDLALLGALRALDPAHVAQALGRDWRQCAIRFRDPKSPGAHQWIRERFARIRDDPRMAAVRQAVARVRRGPDTDPLPGGPLDPKGLPLYHALQELKDLEDQIFYVALSSALRVRSPLARDLEDLIPMAWREDITTNMVCGTGVILIPRGYTDESRADGGPTCPEERKVEAWSGLDFMALRQPGVLEREMMTGNTFRPDGDMQVMSYDYPGPLVLPDAALIDELEVGIRTKVQSRNRSTHMRMEIRGTGAGAAGPLVLRLGRFPPEANATGRNRAVLRLDPRILPRGPLSVRLAIGVLAGARAFESRMVYCAWVRWRVRAPESPGQPEGGTSRTRSTAPWSSSKGT